MAELSSFHFKPGASVLHGLDPRVKLVCLMGLSVASVTASASSMGLATLLMITMLLQSRLSLAALLYEIRYFFLLMVVIFLTRAISTPGEALFAWLFIEVSAQGLISGAMLVWRLLLVVLLGLGLTATTRPAHIRLSIQWFLKPIPWIPHAKIGTMMGLLIRFLPVVLIQAHEIADAQRARCIDLRKNPAYRAGKLSMSLLRKAVVTSDRLALAMVARGYGAPRSSIPLVIRARDWLALSLVAGLCLLMILS
jgi:energy-coupling factor transporter transmembrane protein EcfT